MATLMAGAIVLGSASACVMGFAPFFFALLVSVVLGATVAMLRGESIGHLASPCLVLLVTGQLAYGFGLFGQVALSRLGRWMSSGAWRASTVSPAERGRRVEKVVDPVRNRLG